MIGSFGKDKRDLNTRMEQTAALIRHKNLGDELENKVTRYYEYLWARYRGR
jgi:hypothetical protein